MRTVTYGKITIPLKTSHDIMSSHAPALGHRSVAVNDNDIKNESFAIECLALQQSWDFTDGQLLKWMNAVPSYSVGMIGRLQEIDTPLRRDLPSNNARLTAMVLASIDVLFSMLPKLPENEAHLALGNLNCEIKRYHADVAKRYGAAKAGE